MVLVVIGLAAWLVMAMKTTPPPQAERSTSVASPLPVSSATTTTSVAAAEPANTPAPLPPAAGAPASKKAPAKGPLPPLPMLGFAPPRPIDVVQAVFEFAARRPDILEYVPCFCGCERQGHTGNDDCFVKSRDAAGNVEWEPHGMS